MRALLCPERFVDQRFVVQSDERFVVQSVAVPLIIGHGTVDHAVEVCAEGGLAWVGVLVVPEHGLAPPLQAGLLDNNRSHRDGGGRSHRNAHVRRGGTRCPPAAAAVPAGARAVPRRLAAPRLLSSRRMKQSLCLPAELSM
eukprot:scaffold54116_cov57-Phaeocystis_antarctica.AAC.3